MAAPGTGMRALSGGTVARVWRTRVVPPTRRRSLSCKYTSTHLFPSFPPSFLLALCPSLSYCLDCPTGRRLRSDRVRSARGRAARGRAAAAASRAPPSPRRCAIGSRPPRRASPGGSETRPAGASAHFLLQPWTAPKEYEQCRAAEPREETVKMETYLSHFFQRQPDCRPSAQGIVGVMIPRGPRFKIELVSSRSREHGERHNSFSCSEKTVACRCAASYRRGLVSAAAARPLPRPPSPTRKPGADSSSSRTHAAAKKRSATFRRPPALARAALAPLKRAQSAGGGRRRSRVGAEGTRRPEPARARCIPAADRWYLPSYTFNIITAELHSANGTHPYYFPLLATSRADTEVRCFFFFFKEACGWGFL